MIWSDLDSDVQEDVDYVMSDRDLWRVDGDAVCEDCGRRYYEHAPIRARGFESFYRGCAGQVLKT